MRVLFITRKWPPAVGGMEVYCVELTRELERHVNLTTHYLSGRRNGQPPGPLALAWWCHLLGCNGRQVISVHGTDIAYGIREGGKPALYRRFQAWAA